MRRLGYLLGILAVAAMAFAPNVAMAAPAVYPNGPDGGDGNLDGVGGFFAAGRQLDFDFWFSVLDVVLPNILPTWNSGATPVWTLVTHQTAATFGDRDNDGNTIHDDDHFDLLAAVYNGTGSVVAGIPLANQNNVRNNYNTNRTVLQARELTIKNVRLRAAIVVDIRRDVTTGGTINIPIVGDVDIPSLWTVNEDNANGDKGILSSANPMLEQAFIQVIPAYMTVAENQASTVRVHVASLLRQFITEFLATSLEGLLAGIGDVTSFTIFPNGDIEVYVNASGISARVNVYAADIVNAITDYANQFNCTNFTCGSVIAAANNLNGAGNTNVASWNAAGGATKNRQTFMTNEGIVGPPLQIVPMPVDFPGELGQPIVLGASYGFAGGDGSGRTYDWEDIDPITYENPAPLGGTVNGKTYNIATGAPANAGYYGVAVSDNTWDRTSRSLQLTVTDFPPRVSSVTVNSGTQVDVTFTEAMGTGVGSPSNYTLTGSGKGSLGSNPASVALVSGNTYRLTWAAGEMFNGGNITITVNSAVQSASAQTMGSPNSGTCNGCGVGTPPTVSSITSNNPGPTKVTALTYTVTFSENVSGVSFGKFSLNLTGSATGTLGAVSGGPISYSVQVTGVGGTGNVRLDLSNAAGIVDAAGNPLAATFQGQPSIIDNTPPPVPGTPDLVSLSDSGTSNSDDITKIQTPSLTGTGELNSIIELSSNLQGAIGTTTVASGTTWTLASTSTLVEGVHIITATAKDVVGNISAPSPPLTVTIDITPPPVPGLPNLATASDSGFSNSDDITNVTVPTLEGTRVSGVIVEVESSADGIIGSDTAGGTAYAVVAGAALTANTDHNFRARGIDIAGNISAFSPGLVVKIDTAAPTVASQNPPAGATIAVLPNVGVTFNEAVVNVAGGDLTVNVSPATTVGGSGVGPYSFTGYTIPADALGIPIAIAAGATTDLAGNPFAGSSWTIDKDATAPSISWSAVGVVGGGVTNTDVTLTATFSEPVINFIPGDVVVAGATLSGFSGSGDTYSFLLTAPGGDSNVTVNVPAGVATAVAAPAGRVNAVAPTFSYTSDKTPPVVLSSTPTTPGPTNSSTVTFIVTFDGPVTGFDNAADVTVQNFGTASTGVSIAPVSTSVYSVEVTGVSGSGLMKLRINAGAAQDAAGNVNAIFTPAPGVQIDTVPPVVTVDPKVTNDNTPSLTGTVDDPSASVTVTVNGQNRTTIVTIVGLNAIWTLPDNLLLPLPDGTFDVTATATDFVGNVASDLTTNELTIDATPPVISLLGDPFVAISCGDGYTDPTFTASDNVDGVLTGSVVVTNDPKLPLATPAGNIPVNTSPDTYVTTYTVTDAVGNVTVELRTITVADDCPLAVTATPPFNFERDGGDSVTFSIQASGAIGTLTYQWFHAPSAKAGEVAVPGANSDTLTLTDLTNNDEGNYYCQVADEVTAVQSPTFSLVVFVQSPAVSLLGLGLAASFMAVAGGAAVRRRKR